MKYLEALHVRAAGHIQPLDSAAPTPGDADAFKILAAPRELLGVSMGPELGGGGGTKSDSQGKPN